jgi:adenylate cyclase
VTEAIVATLMAGYGGRLRRAWVERKQLPGFERLEAMDLLYRALDAWDFTKQGIAVARELLDQAVQRDPGFAKAYSKLAFTHMIDATYGYGPTSDYMKSMAEARRLALKAISVDDSDSWAHWALGFYHLYSMHHDQALAEFRVALSCNPNDAEVMADYGMCLSYSGQAEAGIDAALKAMRINPHYYDWYTAQLGQLYFDSRCYDKAIATFASLKQFDSTIVRVYQAASFAMLDRDDEASTSVHRAIELDSKASVNKWGNTRLAPYAKTSDLEHFRTALRKAGLPE